MSTLATYKQSLTYRLASSNTSYHDDTEREAAINEAIGDIAERYDIPALYKRGSLTFTSGMATIPADCLRIVKIWNPTTQTIEYEYIPEDEFDGKPTTAANYWSIDYDTASSTRKIKILPASITTANIRYIFTPAVLANDSDVSSLPTQFDDAVAYKAAAILLRNERSWDAFKAMDDEGNKMTIKAIDALKIQGGTKAGTRLKSRYEKYPLITN
ncbi:MAG: hypothetical protein A4E53_01726 [Pelotomaculum sp. PtaB.Bin104]|nr:MAG: hypothetical protein A4E53_01726 [Pelotomaculum sp. PtaB.Bin104]